MEIFHYDIYEVREYIWAEVRPKTDGFELVWSAPVEESHVFSVVFVQGYVEKSVAQI